MKYNDYINLQKEKTTDPARRKKWLNEEWDLKLKGFERIFNNNKEYIGDKCLCIGARTGQEVQALINIGKDAIGIDLVPCEPLVIEGDFHDLPYEDNSFDFIFSNVFDHALYPDKFCSEALRVLKPEGYILFHLQLNVPNDKYGIMDVNDLGQDFLRYLTSYRVNKITEIHHPEFSTFNREIVIEKI